MRKTGARKGYDPRVIARRWRGWADGAGNAASYVAHLESAVRPRVAPTDGFVDATLERVESESGRQDAGA